MGRDEQKEEREVLDSIFPDEITDVSETEYRVSIALEVSGQEEGDDAPVILLRVSYPDEYPDVAPDLDVGAPHNAPKHKDLDIQEDKARLLEALQPSIEENMGMAMVFTLVSTLKDAAELLIAERQKAAQALKEAEAARLEEEEDRKFQGTAVTRQTFLEWRARFRIEMEEQEKRQQEEREAEERKKKGPASKDDKKLTGKELWERGLAGKFDEEQAVQAVENGDDVGTAADGVQNVAIKD